MESNSGYQDSGDGLYVVVNSGLQPDFQVVERSTPLILAQSVCMAIKTDIRLMLDRTFVAAKNSGIGFNAASIPESFNAPSRGAFDPDYMKALVQYRLRSRQKRNAFANRAAAFSGPCRNSPNTSDKPQSTIRERTNEKC